MKDRAVAVGIVGLGYVGLCTAACFASRGITTHGVDLDEKKLELVSGGRAPFVEEGLPSLLSKSLRTGKLSVSSDYLSLEDADILFVAVGTPNTPQGSIDLNQVESAARSVGSLLRRSSGYKLIVMKSTVIPGTTTSVVKPIIERESGREFGKFGLAANPEFLREGAAIHDTLHPDRIVIGGEDAKSTSLLASLYSRFYGKLPRTIITTPANAELIKYASNAFLATKISFINEIANLCAQVPGADIVTVARGMGLDDRIGARFLNAGLGYGGSCLPKDVSALVRFAENTAADLTVASSALAVNERQPEAAVTLACKLIGDLKGKRIALLGLAFKPGTDDMREAVSLKVVDAFTKEGAEVVAYDPASTSRANQILGDRIAYAASLADCLKGADCAVLVTEWDEFRKLKPKDFKGMKTRALVDGRRVLDPSEFAGRMKFAAVGLGP